MITLIYPLILIASTVYGGHLWENGRRFLGILVILIGVSIAMCGPYCGPYPSDTNSQGTEFVGDASQE